MDTWQNAAQHAQPDCPVCRGTGTYMYDDKHSTICRRCCRHNMGWWPLTEVHGKLSGKWACGAGCGEVLDAVPAPDSHEPATQASTEQEAAGHT